MGGWEGSLTLAWAGSPSGARKRCARGMRRAPREEANSALLEVEEAGEEAEEGLLDVVEGMVAEGRLRCPLAGHRGRASVGRPCSWPEGGDR